MHIMAEGLRFPEGPVSLPDGSLVFVEIEAGRLMRLSQNGTLSVIATLGGGPNGTAIGPDGLCYICNNGGLDWAEADGELTPLGQPADYSGGRIERVDLVTGRVEILYDEIEGRPLKAPNDLVFDAHGGFWFTDSGKSRIDTRDHGAVYYAKTDGSLATRVISPMISPNGIGLSPDGRTLYVSETLTARLWAFDIAEPGRIVSRGGSQHGGRLIYVAGDYRYFDSLAVSNSGNIYVCSFIKGGILKISSDGILIDSIDISDKFVTNICFSAKDPRYAFVTISATGKIARLRL